MKNPPNFNQRGVYRIEVRGHLDASWSEWFEGMKLDFTPDGITILTGLIPDQPALYGLINRIRNIGLELISIQCVEKTRN